MSDNTAFVAYGIVTDSKNNVMFLYELRYCEQLNANIVNESRIRRLSEMHEIKLQKAAAEKESAQWA